MFKQFHIFIFLILILTSCNYSNNVDVVVNEYFITCSKSDFDLIYLNYKEDKYIPITISKGNDSTSISAKMRVRGDTSREDPKKSLKIKFEKLTFDDGVKTLNLNAEYSDKSYVRQFLSSQIMQQAGLACFKTQYAKVYLNGKFLGLYLSVENVDNKFLERNGLHKKGNLYKAKKDGACLSLFDNIDKIWEKKTNEKSGKEDLKQLIHDLNFVPDSSFAKYIKENFVYDKLLNLVALNMLLANGSTYYHNYYLYHHPSGKWEILPWDMDKTLSYYNWMPYVYDRTSSEWESDNVLIERMILNESVFADIRKKMDELSKKLVNLSKLKSTIEKLKITLKSAVELDNTDQIKNIEEWYKSLEEEKDFFENHYSKLKKQFENRPRSFKLNNFERVETQMLTFSWGKSESIRGKKINYTLYLSPHFLFKDSLKTIVVKNLKDTSYTLNDKILEGKYYWKVIASDGEFETEGFNTKSIVVVKTPTILPSKVINTVILDKSKSPYLVAKDILIEATGKLIIEKGVDILFATDANIYVKGQIVAAGTQEEPVVFRPEKKGSYWGWIYLENANESCSFNHVVIDEGVIQSKQSNLTIENSLLKLKNKSQIKGETRTCMVWVSHGNFIFRNNTMVGNNSVGEGINSNYAKSIVENSDFYNVADAIEYICVKDGIIDGNRVQNSPDDAIDLNACSNIKITNNILINNRDKGISIGAEQYGASKNIFVENNILIQNNIGISVKDSSTARLNKNTLYKNNTSIQLYKKRNDYKLGGNAVVLNSIISNSKIKSLDVDKYSTISVTNTMCDSELILGENNIQEIPNFVSTSTFNFKNASGKGADINNKWSSYFIP